MKFYQVTAAPCVGQGLPDDVRQAMSAPVELCDSNPWIQYRAFTAHCLGGDVLYWHGGDRWESDGFEYEFFIEVIDT